MRIRRLDLIAFGPFAGTNLDLGGAPGTVDLVYGPNEAGKSTTLRAISGLLFGIPNDTRDGHRHALTELRIGARLEPRSGPPLEVVRRKGRKGTLLDREGKAVDDALLLPLLGGANADLFASMFGLNHETLRASGDAMLRGKGSVGESLFAAGIGAQNIFELRARLREEAERLYTQRGREQKTVVRALTDVRAAKKSVDDASTSARGYLEQKRGLEEAERERDALRDRRAALVLEQTRLERLLAVSPHLAERARLSGELADLSGVVSLPRDAPERRRAAVRELEESRQERRRTAGEIERLEAQLVELVVPESLLSIDGVSVKGIVDGEKRHNAAVQDLPKVTHELGAADENVKKALAVIDPSLGPEDVERLRVGAGRAGRIRKLGADGHALDVERRRTEREQAALLSRRAGLSDRLLSGLPEGSTLTASALDAPRSLGLPPRSALDRHAAALAALAAEEGALSRDVTRVEQRARDVRRDIDALRRSADPPTEADLARIRAERDAALRSLRADPSAGLSWDTHQSLAQAADDLADRLRREADRVAQLAALAAEEEALERDASALARRGADVVQRRGEELAAFRARFARAGIVPLPVEEMFEWTGSLEKLLELDDERARLQAEAARLDADAKKWQFEWSDVAAPLGGTTPEETLAILEATGELLRNADKKRELSRRVDGMRRDSSRFAEAVRALCEKHLPEAVELDAGEAAQRLIRAHEKARRDDAERTRLASELEEHRRSLAAFESRERTAQDRVDALFAAARVTTLDALEEAERRSDLLSTRTAERERVERRLIELGDGATIEALEASTRGLDADQARARLAELRDEIDQVTDERDGVVHRIATLQGGVSSLSQGAAEAAESLSECVTRLKREVHRYVRVKLASELLEREIERYREANQGPIVERASQLFPRLTLGRYTALRVGFGANDEAVLRAVRPGAADVGVEELSDGTRDALYLALRLASLERYAASNEPMPFVLDDALVHLDDDRARAALSVLGEVSKRTQVVFFTHHARLRELAREALGASGLAEHILPAAT
jgi:uncharacterized protein YhaN